MDNTDQPSPPEPSSVGCDSWTVSPDGQTWKRIHRKPKNHSPRPRHSHYNYHVRPNYQLMINLLHFHLIYHQTTTGVNNSYNRLTLLFHRNLMKTLRPREPDMAASQNARSGSTPKTHSRSRPPIQTCDPDRSRPIQTCDPDPFVLCWLEIFFCKVLKSITLYYKVLYYSSTTLYYKVLLCTTKYDAG